MPKRDHHRQDVSEEKPVSENPELEKDQDVNEYKDKYLRALADYQNLERQTADWKADFTQYANQNLIRQLLEILDDLEKADEHLKDEGVKIILTKFKNVLENEGLVELNLEGKDFNPAEAEVVSTEPGESSSKITKVLQKGYLLKDKIIRPGKVIVSVENHANER